MPVQAPALELDDIQHFLISRPPALAARYEFLSFREPTGGRAWLTGILDKVGTGRGWHSSQNAQNPELSWGNDAQWKPWKSPTPDFSTVTTALGNPAKDAGFPHSPSYDGG